MTDLWSEQVVVGLVDGEPKCCKSFLALDLAVAIAPAPPACVATRLSVLEFCSTPPRGRPAHRARPPRGHLRRHLLAWPPELVGDHRSHPAAGDRDRLLKTVEG